MSKAKIRKESKGKRTKDEKDKFKNLTVLNFHAKLRANV
jgi:hypothetical protein